MMNYPERKSPRLKNWDYTSSAAYFVTICTKDRHHYFGSIENEKVRLSRTGIVADILWYEIKNHASNVTLGEFTVMPNHIHGIIILDNTKTTTNSRGSDKGGEDGNIVDGKPVDSKEVGRDVGRDVACNVPTDVPANDTDPKSGNVPIHNTDPHSGNIHNNNRIPPENNPYIKNEWMAEISPKPNSLSTIVRSYKSAVTKHCNRLELPMAWQSRFHDHIIRSDEAYHKISEYIRNNPLNWKEDKFFD